MKIFMHGNFKTILMAVFFISLIFFGNDSKALIKSSDFLSLSGPGLAADHTIKFGLTKDLPPGGKIEIIMDGEFVVPGEFSHDNIDLAASSDYNGAYTDRELSNLMLGTNEVVNISTSSGELVIRFDFMSGAGIDSGDFVEIELGENALFGMTGSSSQLINPDTTGEKSIEVRLYDNFGNFLERSRIKVFIIKPVTMHSFATKKRFDASPVGWLGYGTNETIMSLYSNFKAVCRYATTTGVMYDDMEDEFTYMDPEGSHYHTVSLTGLMSGGQYEYYVRCRDEFGVSDDYTECIYEVASTSPFMTASGTPILEQDCVDLPILFRISSIEGSVGDETGLDGGSDDGDSDGDNPTTGSTGGGGSGGGSGGGVGNERGTDRGIYLPYPPPPGDPGVILEGWGYSMSFVQIMQDGVPIGWTNSESDGKFGVYMEELSRGMYSFGIWSTDLNSVKSSTYSTTFWIEEGTLTTISDIVIPPTIEISTSSESVLSTFGYSTPGASVDIWVYSQSLQKVDESNSKRYSTIAGDNGRWSKNITLSDLKNDNYYIKAKTIIQDINPSEFSQILKFNKSGEEIVSEEVEGICPGSDLNGDGKVNITDFSILLYHWGGDDKCADQNSNGVVDLIDFSILLYNWTG